jgi:hypothetical protein
MELMRRATHFRASREAQDIEIYIPYAGIGCLGTFAQIALTGAGQS